MYTIVTWLWRPRSFWRTGYAAEHVNTLQRMLAEHVSVPHRLVCVTDMPDGIDCETLPLWPDMMTLKQAGAGANCYRRLRAFAADAAGFFGTDRILSIDLDVLITGDITDLVTATEPFRILQKADDHRHYNGSLWSLQLGSHPHVWDNFNPANSPHEALNGLTRRGIKAVGSDQRWLTHKVPGAATWSVRDGIYQHWALQDQSQIPINCRVLFFAGETKPWTLPPQHPAAQLYQRYRSAA